VERQEIIKEIVRLMEEVNDKYLRRIRLLLILAICDEKKRRN